MLRSASKISRTALPELGVLPQFKGPQPLLSLSHAFKFHAQESRAAPGQGSLSDLASQYLLIEIGRIPAWDRQDAMTNLKTQIQDLFEETLKSSDDVRQFVNLSLLNKFYVTRFYNDAFPYRIMQRYYLQSGQHKDAAEMERVALDKIGCDRSRFHAIAASIEHFDSAAVSLAKYIPSCDKEHLLLHLIINKADQENDSKTVIDAYCSVSDHSAMPAEIFAKVLRHVRLLVPSTYSPPLLVPIKRVYPILSPQFENLPNDSISQEMYQDMALIQCSIGAVDALVQLFNRGQPSFLKNPMSCTILAGAFLRLNMYNSLQQLKSTHRVKLTIPEHVKYATLLADVLPPEQFTPRLGGLRLSAPIVSAALLTYCYTRVGLHDDEIVINAMSAVQQNYGHLARHRPSAIMYASACAERSLLSMPFSEAASEEFEILSQRPAFLSNHKLRRILTSIRAWTAARRGDRKETESIVAKAVIEQRKAPDSLRGAIIRTSAIAAAIAVSALEGDLCRIDSFIRDLKRIKHVPTASVMYSKVLAAAIADEQAQFDEYFNNLHMQLQLEALSPHVVPTLVDLYDSSYFDDSELLKKLFTPERLSGKVTEDKYLVKLRQLPLFSNI